jgi:hypothetical protein
MEVTMALKTEQIKRLVEKTVAASPGDYDKETLLNEILDRIDNDPQFMDLVEQAVEIDEICAKGELTAGEGLDLAMRRSNFFLSNQAYPCGLENLKPNSIIIGDSSFPTYAKENPTLGDELVFIMRRADYFRSRMVTRA